MDESGDGATAARRGGFRERRHWQPWQGCRFGMERRVAAAAEGACVVQPMRQVKASVTVREQYAGPQEVCRPRKLATADGAGSDRRSSHRTRTDCLSSRSFWQSRIMTSGKQAAVRSQRASDLKATCQRASDWDKVRQDSAEGHRRAAIIDVCCFVATSHRQSKNVAPAQLHMCAFAGRLVAAAACDSAGTQSHWR